ncbi:hypothetical protein HY634_03935 [Candidatus Uhrbacteria bacterium]|nr:hypothetical protein [Candidatus Uhrbacteria bacterium]
MSQRASVSMVIGITVLLLGGPILAQTRTAPADAYKVTGTFDIPKKEYRVGDTVRGKFTFLNRERTMTVDIQRWGDDGKIITVKKKIKVKKGGRLTVPVTWKVKTPGPHTLQYGVNGTWPMGRGKIKGFTKTFNYTINERAAPLDTESQATTPTSYVSPHPFTPSSTTVTNIGNVLDCGTDPQCLIALNERFGEHLDACRPATGVTYIGLEGALGFVRNFEIQGIQQTKCVMRFSLAKSPDRTFFDKEMTCRFDAGKYNEQLGGLRQCAGPLADALRGWTPPSE